MASGGQRDIQIESHLGRTVSSEMWYFSRAERAFIVSEEYTNSSTGETATMTLSNPSGSGVTAIFSPIQPSAAVRSYVRVYDEFSTAPSGGGDAGVQNVLLDAAGGAPDTGEVTASRGDTFTASDTHVSETIAGGTGATAIGSARDMPVLALEPSRTIVVEVEKLASGPDPVTITARYFEVPQIFSEETEDPPVSEAYE